MKYEVIKPTNIKPHLDIEKDIKARKDGLFTFTVRINSGNIVDYSVTEYDDARRYLALKSIVIEELTIAHHIGTGSGDDTLRDDNL